jgi:UDP-N-acetylmuramate dehydrogenase
MNPKSHGIRAWEVVEKLGLRGHRIGNAQVSEKHPNFIVNLGGATSTDVRALIELIKTRAQAELGIEMHEEVRILP